MASSILQAMESVTQGAQQLGQGMGAYGMSKGYGAAGQNIMKKKPEEWGGEQNQQLAAGLATTGDIKGAASLQPKEEKMNLEQMYSGLLKKAMGGDPGAIEALKFIEPKIKAYRIWGRAQGSTVNYVTAPSPETISAPMRGVFSNLETPSGEDPEKQAEWLERNNKQIQKNFNLLKETYKLDKSSLDYLYNAEITSYMKGAYGDNINEYLEDNPEAAVGIPHMRPQVPKKGDIKQENWTIPGKSVPASIDETPPVPGAKPTASVPGFDRKTIEAASPEDLLATINDPKFSTLTPEVQTLITQTYSKKKK